MQAAEPRALEKAEGLTSLGARVPRHLHLRPIRSARPLPARSVGVGVGVSANTAASSTSSTKSGGAAPLPLAASGTAMPSVQNSGSNGTHRTANASAAALLIEIRRLCVGGGKSASRQRKQQAGLRILTSEFKRVSHSYYRLGLLLEPASEPAVGAGMLFGTGT